MAVTTIYQARYPTVPYPAGPTRSPAAASAHGSEGSGGADTSNASAGSPAAAGVASSAEAGTPKRAANGRFLSRKAG